MAVQLTYSQQIIMQQYQNLILARQMMYGQILSENRSSSIDEIVEEKPVKFSFGIDSILKNEKKPISNQISMKSENLEIPRYSYDNRELDKYSKKDSSEKDKRNRTVFTKYQLDEMEKEFGRHKYLTGTDRSEVAERLG